MTIGITEGRTVLCKEIHHLPSQRCQTRFAQSKALQMIGRPSFAAIATGQGSVRYVKPLSQKPAFPAVDVLEPQHEIGTGLVGPRVVCPVDLRAAVARILGENRQEPLRIKGLDPSPISLGQSIVLRSKDIGIVTGEKSLERITDDDNGKAPLPRDAAQPFRRETVRQMPNVKKLAKTAAARLGIVNENNRLTIFPKVGQHPPAGISPRPAKDRLQAMQGILASTPVASRQKGQRRRHPRSPHFNCVFRVTARSSRFPTTLSKS